MCSNPLTRKSLWERVSCCRSAFIFIFLFSITASSAQATWRLIALFDDVVRASFFFDEQRGLIGLEGGGPVAIKRTSDGGRTWLDCSTPPGYYGYITDIFMKDSLNGWAGIENSNTSHGLWFTTDAGVSWHEDMNMIGQPSAVYQTSSAVIVADRYSVNSLSINTSGIIGSALTLFKVSNDRFNGINFVDDLHGVATVYSAAGAGNGTAMWTRDGGVNWQKTANNPETEEAWGVYAQKGSSNFLVCGEKSGLDLVPTEHVDLSTDYGASWQYLSTVGGRTTGHIAGVGPVVYVQSFTHWQYRANPIIGMLRSTDGGRTWKMVGGPSNYRDTRFSVVGCLGATVYAFDEDGGVWKTTDGGNGDIHEPPHNPNLAPDHLDLASSMCSLSTASLSYNNLSCDTMKIESISFIDSTDPSVSTGALSFSRYPVLPQTLIPASSDFFTLNWEPGKLGVQKPLSTTFVKLHCTVRNGLMVFDTLIPVNSQSFANQPVFSLNTTSVRLDSMNICQRFIDTSITFTSSSCDTLWLDSALISGSTDWKLLDPQTLAPLALPIGVLPGKSATFVMRYNPVDVGAQTAKIKLHFFHQGLTRDTTLTFAGNCYRTFTVYGDDKINLAPTSICTTIDTVVYLHNVNCDTLTVDSYTNSNPGVFAESGAVSFPYQIPPDSTLALHLRYNGIKNVTSFSLIVFHFHLAADTAIWETTLKGSGLPGTSAFVTSLPAPQITFADRVACSPPDSMVFDIVNTGCDSLSILSSTISLLGLPAISYRTEPALPTVLSHPSDRLRVIVYLQADNPTTNDGTLKISYQLSDYSQHDSTFTIHASVSRGARIATISQDPIDMEMGSLCIGRDTTIDISNFSCPALTVKSISVAGNFFSGVNIRTTPFDLARGESYSFKVRYDPTASGTDAGQVAIETNADVDSNRIIPLTASTKQIDHVSFRLIQQNSNLHAGDTAILAFAPDNDWTGKGLQTLDFSIVTNSDLLSYGGHLQQYDNTFQAFATLVSLAAHQSQLNVHMFSPTEITLKKDQPLVYFYYGTALADTISTSVALSLLQINNADPHYANCILSSSYQDLDFTLQLECGGKTLIDYLKGKMPLMIEDPRPNPVTLQSNYQAILPFTAYEAGNAEISYFDALGRCVSSETLAIDKPGKYSLHFDGAKLAGGNYEYVLRFKDGASNSSRGHLILLK
ncbi:MAG: choice-of-anchor D domain-containing protein [Bacteroidota bacterium]|nr:choice-of-anchor D domain-containing protein [Bacteroidota bacterium]